MVLPSFLSPRLRGLWVLAASLVIIALASGLKAPAQSFDATTLRQSTDLGTAWLVHAGDDPAYAQTSFDDSHWTVIDPYTSLHSYFQSRPKVLWYRLHVKVSPNQSGLGLAEWNLASAFEVYVNGEKIMQTGSVAPYRPYNFSARLLHPISDSAVASGELVIALRIYISSTDWLSPFPGFYPQNLTIGLARALSDHIWLNVIGENALQWFYILGGLGLGFIALALFTAQPQQREYLWIFLLFLSSALNTPIQLYQLFHNLPVWSLYVNGCFHIAGLVFQMLTYLAFLRMPVVRWIQVLIGLSALGTLLNSAQAAMGNGSPTAVLTGAIPQVALIAGVVPILLIVHWRRGNREAGILLVPAIVYSLAVYLQLGIFLTARIPALAGAALNFANTVFNLKLGPFNLNLQSMGGCLFVLSLGIILVRRSTRIAHQQAQIETEMAAAREVQKIILPEEIESVPGFEVQAAYAPAQQVGGDFFQILPAAEGSLLLVIGDVAGKGLPAAMLVSVLVGAIRGVAEYTAEPAELLANLNQRLVGRVAGNFATALAARIFPDGAVALANAGHLAPYLDGKEVDVPGALPLGAKAGTHYETVRFMLPRSSTLMFYSDGIVEAQNAAGELFGFERSRGISTEPVNKIVETARMYGQHDDMTAISITRAAAVEARQWSPETAPDLGVVTQ